jgi:hypothetical protein
MLCLSQDNWTVKSIVGILLHASLAAFAYLQCPSERGHPAQVIPFERR